MSSNSWSRAKHLSKTFSAFLSYSVIEQTVPKAISCFETGAGFPQLKNKDEKLKINDMNKNSFMDFKIVFIISVYYFLKKIS